MRMNHESALAPRWIVFGTALVYFVLGSLLTVQFMHLKEVWADSHRVSQLEIYHAVPGNVPALEERFRNFSKLQARHCLELVGYWVPEDAKFTQTNPAFANRFAYLVDHASQAEAKTHWDVFHADPAFQEYVQSEKAEQLIQGADSTLMRPTRSAMK
ncbi:MAG TPA: NIPSNAP family protein [Acidobacteriaceae bacterium]|nr:NIPSNAP family protein [Acidobacteriaceae bacterium]